MINPVGGGDVAIVVTEMADSAKECGVVEAPGRGVVDDIAKEHIGHVDGSKDRNGGSNHAVRENKSPQHFCAHRPALVIESQADEISTGMSHVAKEVTVQNVIAGLKAIGIIDQVNENAILVCNIIKMIAGNLHPSHRVNAYGDCSFGKGGSEISEMVAPNRHIFHHHGTIDVRTVGNFKAPRTIFNHIAFQSDVIDRAFGSGCGIVGNNQHAIGFNTARGSLVFPGIVFDINPAEGLNFKGRVELVARLGIFPLVADKPGIGNPFGLFGREFDSGAHLFKGVVDKADGGGG